MVDQEQELQNLISQGEHLHQDFKYFVQDSRKIARSLCAFANTDGGRLLIGVKDNGAIVGVKTDEEFYMIEAAAEIYSKPPVTFVSKIWKIAGKSVLEINIPESTKKPHFVINQDGTRESFIRIDDENIIAPSVITKIWIKQNQKKDRLMRYSGAEEILFDYLELNQHITVSAFKKLAKLSEKSCVEIISNLVVFNILQYEFEQGEFRFIEKSE